ncbi:hypothetical protein BDV96DRAFT_561564, partial [Lophiotrema nucula]
MKAIAAMTLIFLPGTFICVSQRFIVNFQLIKTANNLTKLLALVVLQHVILQLAYRSRRHRYCITMGLLRNSYTLDGLGDPHMDFLYTEIQEENWQWVEEKRNTTFAKRRENKGRALVVSTFSRV